MKSGPAPKPTNLKKLAGNPGKRPLNDAEPRFPVPDRTPYVPRHLSETAKKEWRRIVSRLMQAGLYTEADEYAVVMLCEAWAEYLEAKEMLRTVKKVLHTDSGYAYQSPWLQIRNKAFDQVYKMLGHFGFTPAERSRVEAAWVEEEPSLVEMLFAGIEDE